MLPRRSTKAAAPAKAASSKKKAPPSEVDVNSETEVIPPPKRQRTKALDDPFPHIKRGGKAAMEVYETLELRQNILSYLDYGTLAGMLRLEQAVTCSIAGILYRTVHVSQLPKMSRANLRRQAYCDAVWHLDLNPLPSITSAPESGTVSVPCNSSLLKDLPKWRVKLPQLRTVFRDRPSHPTDESFIVRLSDEAVTLEMESQHTITIYPFPEAGPPALPPVPKLAGYDVKHTIALHLSGTDRSGLFQGLISGFNPGTLAPTLGAWRNWLFTDQNLDSRVSSVDCDSRVKPSYDDVIAFVSRRQGNAVVTQTFCVPPVEILTVDQLRQILANLDPQLRTLKITSPIAGAGKFWPAIIAFIDKSCPSLQKLCISNNSRIPSSAVLSGLPQLKEFRFPGSHKMVEDPLALARSVYRVGAHGCAFYLSSHDDKSRRLLQSLIVKLRSPKPKYAQLHFLTARDLDLFTAADIASYSYEPINGQFRRGAFDAASSNAGHISKAQDKLDALGDRQKKAVQSFQQALDRTTAGRADANGDPQAENALLKLEFEKVLREQVELGKACAGMQNLAAEVDKKSRTMLQYAQTWLTGHNKGK